MGYPIYRVKDKINKTNLDKSDWSCDKGNE